MSTSRASTVSSREPAAELQRAASEGAGGHMSEPKPALFDLAAHGGPMLALGVLSAEGSGSTGLGVVGGAVAVGAHRQPRHAAPASARARVRPRAPAGSSTRSGDAHREFGAWQDSPGRTASLIPARPAETAPAPGGRSVGGRAKRVSSAGLSRGPVPAHHAGSYAHSRRTGSAPGSTRAGKQKQWVENLQLRIGQLQGEVAAAKAQAERAESALQQSDASKLQREVSKLQSRITELTASNDSLKRQVEQDRAQVVRLRDSCSSLHAALQKSQKQANLAQEFASQAVKERAEVQQRLNAAMSTASNQEDNAATVRPWIGEQDLAALRELSATCSSSLQISLDGLRDSLADMAASHIQAQQTSDVITTLEDSISLLSGADNASKLAQALAQANVQLAAACRENKQLSGHNLQLRRQCTELRAGLKTKDTITVESTNDVQLWLQELRRRDLQGGKQMMQEISTTLGEVLRVVRAGTRASSVRSLSARVAPAPGISQSLSPVTATTSLDSSAGAFKKDMSGLKVWISELQGDQQLPDGFGGSTPSSVSTSAEVDSDALQITATRRSSKLVPQLLWQGERTIGGLVASLSVHQALCAADGWAECLVVKSESDAGRAAASVKVQELVKGAKYLEDPEETNGLIDRMLAALCSSSGGPSAPNSATVQPCKPEPLVLADSDGPLSLLAADTILLATNFTSDLKGAVGTVVNGDLALVKVRPLLRAGAGDVHEHSACTEVVGLTLGDRSRIHARVVLTLVGAVRFLGPIGVHASEPVRQSQQLQATAELLGPVVAIARAQRARQEDSTDDEDDELGMALHSDCPTAHKSRLCTGCLVQLQVATVMLVWDPQSLLDEDSATCQVWDCTAGARLPEVRFPLVAGDLEQLAGSNPERCLLRQKFELLSGHRRRVVHRGTR